MNDGAPALTNAAFEIGDTVSLNSGGHLMTIISIDDDLACCAWSVKGDVKSKSFPIKALKKHTGADGEGPVAVKLSLDYSRLEPHELLELKQLVEKAQWPAIEQEAPMNRSGGARSQ
jgi:hypothetical protein